MIDQAATTALANSIKTAFANALPNTLSNEIKAPIIATYDTMCASIAEAIRQFVLSAQVEVKLSSNDVVDAIRDNMTSTQYLNVSASTGQPGGMHGQTATLTGQHIAMLFTRADEQQGVNIDGVLK